MATGDGMIDKKKYRELVFDHLDQSEKRSESEKQSGTPLHGGAPLYGYPYSDQLAAKLAVLKELYSPLLSEEQLDSLELIPSPHTTNYRVKMEYVLSQGKFGLRKSRRFNEVIDITEPVLVDQEVFAKLRQLFELSKQLGIPDFDVEGNTGFLRYFVVKTFGSDETMLNFVTAEQGYQSEMDQLATKAIEMGIKSVNWVLVPPDQDVTFGEPIKTWGEEYVELAMRGKRYLIGVNTFSQNNIPGFSKLLDFALPYVQGERVLDLFCGVGTIALQIADQVQEVVGVEQVADSIDLANQNAQLNGVGNAKFVTARVQDFLCDPSYAEYSFWKHSDPTSRYRNDNPHFDTIIVDPARPGLDKKICRRLLKYFSAERIIYISCNPLTQARDLQQLIPEYKIEAIKLFDLFPQTLHVEGVVVLSRFGVTYF